MYLKTLFRRSVKERDPGPKKITNVFLYEEYLFIDPA